MILELSPDNQARPGWVRDGVPHAAAGRRKLLRGKIPEAFQDGEVGRGAGGLAPQQAAGRAVNKSSEKVSSKVFSLLRAPTRMGLFRRLGKRSQNFVDISTAGLQVCDQAG